MPLNAGPGRTGDRREAESLKAGRVITFQIPPDRFPLAAPPCLLLNPSAVSDEIVHLSANRIGFIELERPSALNALSTGMIRAMHAALERWRENPEVLAVVVRSQHPRAFCAGGDIRFLYESYRRGDQQARDTFFIEEYRLNHAIFTLSEAVHRVDERRGDGRRHGYFAGRASYGRPARGDRVDPHGDAGNPHRALSRCRRELVSGAHARRARPLSGGNRRDDRRGRRAVRRSRRCYIDDAALPALVDTLQQRVVRARRRCGRAR